MQRMSPNRNIVLKKEALRQNTGRYERKICLRGKIRRRGFQQVDAQGAPRLLFHRGEIVRKPRLTQLLSHAGAICLRQIWHSLVPFVKDTK
ncbi:hypothetical protein SDC9_147965 [bioreactor metagenome]|uniref:Uncharacterized protein n=1 Tax=bioreactor metagenome TaxID=1076179 RepID=A0A645EGA3_9ZZZZ